MCYGEEYPNHWRWLSRVKNGMQTGLCFGRVYVVDVVNAAAAAAAAGISETLSDVCSRVSITQ